MNVRLAVTLYGKAACGLCDEARADLDLLAGEIDFAVTEIDITTHPDLFERFQYLIPAVDIGQGDLLTPPLTIRRLRDALTAAGEHHG